jgi:hypothetical protein
MFTVLTEATSMNGFALDASRADQDFNRDTCGPQMRE